MVLHGVSEGCGSAVRGSEVGACSEIPAVSAELYVSSHHTRPSTDIECALEACFVNGTPLYCALGCHRTSGVCIQPLHLLSLGVVSPARASRAQGLIWRVFEHTHATPPNYNLLRPNSLRGTHSMHGHDIGG